MLIRIPRKFVHYRYKKMLVNLQQLKRHDKTFLYGTIVVMESRRVLSALAYGLDG